MGGLLIPWNLVSASSAFKTAAEKRPSNVVLKMKLSHCEQNIRPVLGSAPGDDRQTAARIEIRVNCELTEEVAGRPQVTTNMAPRPTPRVRAMQTNEWSCEGHAASPARRRRDLSFSINSVTRALENTVTHLPPFTRVNRIMCPLEVPG